MEISQLQRIAILTQNKEIISKLFDLDIETINTIIHLIDTLKTEEIEYNDEELALFINEIIIGLKENAIYDNNSHKMLKDLTNRKVDKQNDPTIREIINMLRLFRTEEYNPLALDIIRRFKPILSEEDFNKVFKALKSKNYEVNIGKYSFVNNDTGKIVKTRTIDEICQLIKEDNGLTPNQIVEIYFDKDMLNSRTFEESRRLGNKVMEAYNSSNYQEKVKDSNKLKLDDIESLSIDKNMLSYLTCEEQLKLMTIFIDHPSDRLFKILTNGEVIKLRSFEEIILLIEQYINNRDSYNLIVNHNLLTLPIQTQIEYIEFLSTINSPFIKEEVINSDKILTREELEKLRELDKPITVQQELQNAKDIDDFINSLIQNNITTFDSQTKVYTKKAIKPKE